jgi:hypothetical protein
MAGESSLPCPKGSDDPFMDLLWGWWVTATQALVDTIGPEAAMKALRPYYLNANTAAMAILSEHFEKYRNEPDFGAKTYQFGGEVWLGGYWTTRTSPEKGVTVSEVRGCKTRGECKELCQLTCHDMALNGGRALGFTNLRAQLAKGLFKGDDHCIIIFRWGDRTDQTIESTSPIEPILVRPEERDVFRTQYVGESWVFTTMAFIDVIGNEAALDKLRMYMRHSGLTYGIRLAEEFENVPRGLKFLGEVIGSINDHHMRNGRRTTSDDEIEQVVEECPFSQAPPEVCIQYEAFFKGVCEAIDPDVEFVYDRMMSVGDPTCHWFVRRKSRSTSLNPSAEALDNAEIVKRLKWRLANGEIGIEEFRRLIDVINEQ